MVELLQRWPDEGASVWHHARIVLGEPCPFAGLPEDVWEALSAPETRPNCAALEGGVLLLLRGVNVNPGSQPEDMVSVRIWIGQGAVYSTTLRRVFAAADTREALAAGEIEAEPYAIVLHIAERLAARIREAILVMDEASQEVEAQLLAHDTLGRVEIPPLQTELRHLRRRAVLLRRYMLPQSVALADFRKLTAQSLSKDLGEDYSQVANEMQRVAEAVHTLAEYGTVLQDQIDSMRDAQMARTSYFLSLVAAIFLPLNLLAAVFGANVGGIPWSDTPWGFVALSVLSLAIAIAGVWLLRWRRWL
ncbi:MAG: hypothetical protein KDC18_12935 [Alphaproteobacteria bacterium]|nr:hypothetical protein [Alphaproteobacteria bacterium]MCB9929260.1 hypothetical protein [Alphaproteobacteria bacterium]